MDMKYPSNAARDNKLVAIYDTLDKFEFNFEFEKSGIVQIQSEN